MENLDFLKQYYKELLDDCVVTGLDFFKTNDRDSFYNWSHKSHGCPEDVYSANGATKAVLWTDEMPYVIKIPFIDQMSCYRDFCELELINYKLAQNCPQIADCFAWCDFLFYYYDTPIYIMEKADCDEDEIYSSAYDAALSESCASNSVRKGSAGYNDYCEAFSEEWEWMDGTEQVGYLYYREWGIEIATLFEEFCSEHSINDLHSANWGYVNGRLVVVDYSGF